MWPVSNGFLAALRTSHTRTARAEVWSGGQRAAELDVIDGQVTVDGKAAIRRSCTVELSDPTGDYTPEGLESLLAPNGNELRLFRGVSVDGVTPVEEEVPLGVFVLSDVAVVETAQGVRVLAEGFDRSRKVQRARWEQPNVILPGTTYTNAIRDLIASRLPGTLFNFAEVSDEAPNLILGQESDNDPWKDALKLADAIGHALYFDAAGYCVLRPVLDVLTAPVSFTYDSGELGVLTEVEKKLTDEGAYNGVVVVGEGPQLAAPVRSIVWDDDPESPTYYLGDYGRVPRFFSSEYLTSQAQADAAALAIFATLDGASEDVRFSAVVNPAHEAGDVIRAVSSGSKVNSRYVLDSFSVPMGAGPMQATTRRKAA